VDDQFSLRRFGLATIALLVVLLAGTLGFHWILGEDYVSAFYRVVVTVSLTGLDTKPAGHAAEVFTVAVLLAGVAIFLYVADAIVEMIARGVFTGARHERRKRKLIEKLRDHHVICGYGRVGQRVAREFRDAGLPSSSSTLARSLSKRRASGATSSWRGVGPTMPSCARAASRSDRRARRQRSLASRGFESPMPRAKARHLPRFPPFR